MPSSAVNPPDSPPNAPVITEGFATKLGKAGTMLLAIVAAVQPFLEGDHTGDMRFFSVLATAVGIGTILGRMLQSAAALRDAPSPAQLDDDDDEPLVPVTTEAAPSEASLMAEYANDAPIDQSDLPTGRGKAGERS